MKPSTSRFVKPHFKHSPIRQLREFESSSENLLEPDDLDSPRNRTFFKKLRNAMKNRKLLQTKKVWEEEEEEDKYFEEKPKHEPIDYSLDLTIRVNGNVLRNRVSSLLTIRDLKHLVHCQTNYPESIMWIVWNGMHIN